MLVTFRRSKSAGSIGEILFNKKISGRYFREKIISKIYKGFHITKTGRLMNIYFEVNFDDDCTGIANIELTEFEIFQMAKWSRRGKSDQEFLDAIMKQD